MVEKATGRIQGRTKTRTQPGRRIGRYLSGNLREQLGTKLEPLKAVQAEIPFTDGFCHTRMVVYRPGTSFGDEPRKWSQRWDRQFFSASLAECAGLKTGPLRTAESEIPPSVQLPLSLLYSSYNPDEGRSSSLQSKKIRQGLTPAESHLLLGPGNGGKIAERDAFAGLGQHLGQGRRAESGLDLGHGLIQASVQRTESDAMTGKAEWALPDAWNGIDRVNHFEDGQDLGRPGRQTPPPMPRCDRTIPA